MNHHHAPTRWHLHGRNRKHIPHFWVEIPCFNASGTVKFVMAWVSSWYGRHTKNRYPVTVFYVWSHWSMNLLTNRRDKTWGKDEHLGILNLKRVFQSSRLVSYLCKICKLNNNNPINLPPANIPEYIWQTNNITTLCHCLYSYDFTDLFLLTECRFHIYHEFYCSE